MLNSLSMARVVQVLPWACALTAGGLLAANWVVRQHRSRRSEPGAEPGQASLLREAQAQVLEAEARALRAEEALSAAQEVRLDLEAQLRQSRKLESLGTLAGGLAHDLNNVLGAILTVAAGPRANLEASDPLAMALDTITNACLRGSGLAGGLLRYVRKEEGPRLPVDLNAIAMEMVQLLGPGTAKGATLVLALQEPLPKVLGDAGALSHALMNLCVNATDATPKGGIITLRTSVDARGRVCLSVRDTGAGMPSEVMDRAVEAFFTTKPPGEGTGLGLTMVATTMSAHGGSLELASRPGEGTEATLTLPAAAPSAVPLVMEPLRSLRILLVDDDPHLRGALCPLLESFGHSVREAGGGREAIRIIEEGLAVDLVLLDLDMPGLSGAQTLHCLLALKPGLPVLMSSGYDEQHVAGFLVGHPTVSSIQKPFTMNALQAKLAELLTRTGA